MKPTATMYPARDFIRSRLLEMGEDVGSSGDKPYFDAHAREKPRQGRPPVFREVFAPSLVLYERTVVDYERGYLRVPPP